MIRRLLLLSVLAFLLLAESAYAACTGTGTAIDPWTATNAADLQDCFTNHSTHSGDYFHLNYNGTLPISTQLTWTAPANSTFYGNGSTSITGGNDVTSLSDEQTGSAPILFITTNASGTFRMYGLTFKGGTLAANNDKYDGIVGIGGSGQQIRVDHVHFNTTTYSTGQASSGIQFNGCTAGVIDHSLFDNPVNGVNNSIRDYNGASCNSDALGLGDQSWTLPTNLGTSNFIFAEDNTFNSGWLNDCTSGGRFVFRFNILNIDGTQGGGQTHPTGGGARHRGCRAWEFYQNQFIAASGRYVSDAHWISSGTGVIWGEYIPSSSAGGGTGYRNAISVHEMRYKSQASGGTYTQSATPAGWGYCSNLVEAVGSNWDQSATTGHLCLDQPGAGIGQLLINDFPNVLNNSTGTIAWPNQALEPIYTWLSAWTQVPSNPGSEWSIADPMFTSAVDYYLGTGTTSVTGGVGNGTFAQMSAIATCNDGEGFWATDKPTVSWNDGSNGHYTGKGSLYKCASNSWNLFYTPYDYPHPLVSGGGGGDTTAPVFGASGAITFASVTSSTITVNWTKATDETTSQGSLQYEVCRSTSTISSTGTCESNIVMSFTTDVATYADTGLSSSTTYHYNVVVKDAAGNKTLYVDNSQATSSAAVAVIASVLPVSGGRGKTVAIVVTGTNTNFQSNVSVCSFSPASGITVTSTTVASATSATCNVTIANGAALSYRTMRITTGSEYADLSSAFQVIGGGTMLRGLRR